MHQAVSPCLSDIAIGASNSDVRDLLHHASRPGVISFAGGLPAKELFDLEGMKDAIDAVLAKDPRAALQYGPTEGQPALRTALCDLLFERGITAKTEEVLVTTGSQQGIDLLARALLNPNDLLAVESPTYLAAVNAFALTKPRFLEIPSTPDGMDVEALMRSPELPKVVYVVPSFSNPCGTTMSLDKRLALVHWAARNHVLVIEDDPYGELSFPGSTRLPTLYELASKSSHLKPWVTYLSTLSKVVSPGFRIGWILASKVLLNALAQLKQAVDLHTSTFVQEVAAQYLASGTLRPSVERMRKEYGNRARAMRQDLQAAFGDNLQILPATGGMFFWARFKDGTNTRALFNEALARNVIFVPGSAFYPNGNSGANELRLSFVSNAPDVIRQGVCRLAQAHQSMQNAATEPAPFCA